MVYLFGGVYFLLHFHSSQVNADVMDESGDVELNPGTKRDFDQCFPVRHWNLSNPVKPNLLIWW